MFYTKQNILSILIRALVNVIVIWVTFYELFYTVVN